MLLILCCVIKACCVCYVGMLKIVGRGSWCLFCVGFVIRERISIIGYCFYWYCMSFCLFNSTMTAISTVIISYYLHMIVHYSYHHINYYSTYLFHIFPLCLQNCINHCIFLRHWYTLGILKQSTILHSRCYTLMFHLSFLLLFIINNSC